MLRAFTDRAADIRIEDVAVPEPGPGEVRVRMLLSPVNPSDLNFVHGTYYRALERVIWNQGRADGEPVCFDRERKVVCPLPPYGLGLEGVGVVEACGEGWLAKRLRGKRVAIASGPPNGTWQEYTIVNARRALVVPDGLADEQAAMYLANPVSACIMVREILRVPRGAWVLLTAAGSALGKSIVRLGRRDGFRTLCVVRSAANSAELNSLGADAVVETNRQDLVSEVARITARQGVSYALDCVGGAVAEDILRCLGPGGHLLVYGTLADEPMRLPSRDLMMPLAKVSGFYLGNWMAGQSPVKLLGLLRSVKKLATEGIFDTPVSDVLPLDDVVRAVELATAPGRTGKVLLRIGTR
jgi:NADPH:quinone reductase-like Zn-dependent oxidoreductase